MSKNDKEKIFEKAKEVIVQHNLIFVEDVIAMIGISRSSFYEKITGTSEEMDKLKELLSVNKIEMKVALRKKWKDSDNATLQMALYKLCSTDIEHKKLNQNYTDHTSDGKVLNEIEFNVINSK